jgi:DNA repair exonuclease SbcCD ATPase subunit
MADLEPKLRGTGVKWPGGAVSPDLNRLLAVLGDLLVQVDSRLRQCAGAAVEGQELVAGRPAMEHAQQSAPTLMTALSAARAESRAIEQEQALAAKEVEDLSAELARTNGELGARKRDREAFARFLVSARAFLPRDRCPVCEQPIDSAHVEGRIAERTKSLSPAERALIQARNEAEGRVQAARARLEAVNARSETIRAKDRSAARALADAKHTAETWTARQTKLVEAWSPAADLPAALRSAVQLERRLGDLRSTLSRLQSEAQVLAEQGELAAATETVRQLKRQREALTFEQKRLTAASSTLRKLTGDAKAAEVAIVEQAIKRQMPVLKAIYARLNPHPLFDSLEVTYSTYAGRGEVYYQAASGKTSGNVNMMFSSAQLNAVGVCIFLSLSLLRPEGGLAWVLLDDPIQNMDDYNVLGLVDLLRSLRGKRQVIVSTHDDQIGELLRRKLRPQGLGERTAVHRFVSIDEQGPNILSTVDEYRHEPFVLESAIVG